MSPSDATESGSSSAAAKPGHKPPASWLFLLLSMPYGVYSGAVTGSLLSFLLRREGHAMYGIANELAVLGIPAMLYFLWSPLVDFWMSRKAWYLLAICLTAVGSAAAFCIPDLSSPLAVVLLFAAMCTVMMTSAAFGGIAASQVPEEMKSRVSSMVQAGNLGGGALGAGGLLLLAEHVSRPVLGLIGAASVLLPGLAVLALDAPPPRRAEGGAALGAQLVEIGREFKTVFLRWGALPSILLITSPLCSGGAASLLPGIATDYHVSGSEVAWLNGIFGSLLTAAGALLMAIVPKRTDPRLTYILFGLVNAASIGVLCLGPTNPGSYLVGTVFYLVTVGAGYANFTALVFQVIGDKGTSASSRYAITVSLGNIPVSYMAAVDGLGAKWWGTRGLSGMDMGLSALVGVVYLACYWLWIRPHWERHIGTLPEPVAVPSAD
jgi:MFS transporter, PAT family, beta-lactamase induction signal transducer AmpG